MRWITILVFVALVVTQMPGRFDAEASAPLECDRWVIAIIPVPGECSLTAQSPRCQPPEGWEPVSGVTYGEAAESGVLLRRCLGK